MTSQPTCCTQGQSPQPDEDLRKRGGQLDCHLRQVLSCTSDAPVHIVVCVLWQAEEGEQIPEELASFIVRKPADDRSSMEGARVNEGVGREELSRLRQELEEERKWRENLARDKAEMARELEALKVKTSELTRRHSDATRAYEQERRVSVCVYVCVCARVRLYAWLQERVLQEARNRELEEDLKVGLRQHSPPMCMTFDPIQSIQELKVENQRLKDENGALIRVIGKLSRSPLPSSTV